MLAHPLGPFVVSVAIGLSGHEGFHAALGQLLLELLSYERILVRIFDLVLGPVPDLFGERVLPLLKP